MLPSASQTAAGNEARLCPFPVTLMWGNTDTKNNGRQLIAWLRIRASIMCWWCHFEPDSGGWSRAAVSCQSWLWVCQSQQQLNHSGFFLVYVCVCRESEHTFRNQGYSETFLHIQACKSPLIYSFILLATCGQSSSCEHWHLITSKFSGPFLQTQPANISMMLMLCLSPPHKYKKHIHVLKSCVALCQLLRRIIFSC